MLVKADLLAPKLPLNGVIEQYSSLTVSIFRTAGSDTRELTLLLHTIIWLILLMWSIFYKEFRRQLR